MEFKVALKQGLYDYEIARNWYRTVSSPDNGGAGMHRDLVFAWIRNNALLIAPFTPHFSEHIWQEVLGETSSVQNASFPVPSAEPASEVIERLEYMRGVVDTMRSAEAAAARRKGGKGKDAAAAFDPTKPKSARIYVASDFPQWQSQCMEVLRAAWDEKTGVVDEGKMRAELSAAGLIKDKRVMPFCQTIKVRRKSTI